MTFHDSYYMQQSVYCTILQLTNVTKCHCMSQFTNFFLSAVSINIKGQPK